MSKLRARIATSQADEAKIGKSSFVAFVLARASLTYRFGVAVRDWLYRIGFFTAKRCEGKVISIGNITTGGTGKTPFTLFVAQWLQSRNVSFAILSRGYRSQSEKKGLVFNSETLPANETVGDEMALLARKLPRTWFGIGRDRRRNIRILQMQHGIRAFVMDDGFQHRKLHRDLDIVLVDAVNPFGNGWLLPSGSLREPISSLSRADAVVITRTESVHAADLADLNKRISKFVGADRVFEVRTLISNLRDFANGSTIDLASLTRGNCILFSGIGNPNGFSHLLRANGIAVSKSIVFDDHHRYCEADISGLRGELAVSSNTLLLTTEKDAIKLPRDAFAAGECAVVEITIAFAGREDIFWGKIAEVLAC